MQECVTQTSRRGQWTKYGGDLDCQLTRGHQDERLDAANLWLGSRDQRQDERKRLTRPGARLADDVLALEEHGYSRCLNGRRRYEALRGESALQCGLQIKVGERGRPSVSRHLKCATNSK